MAGWTLRALAPTAPGDDAPSVPADARPPDRDEQACQNNGGGAYLRREGLYSSLISEWSKQRDAMHAHHELTESGVSTRDASILTGIACCTATRDKARPTVQVKERRRRARRPFRACPELVATAPRQVYSWGITKVPGPVKGTYFDAYMMIDIFSRYIVGAHVQTHESGLLAAEMMTEIFAVHGIPNVVHADRGTSMTSETVATLLADLEVTRSHSRLRVSNDNPYSESLFKSFEYGPM